MLSVKTLPRATPSTGNQAPVARHIVESKNHLELARRAMSARQPYELDSERRRRHFEGLYERVIRNGVIQPARSV